MYRFATQDVHGVSTQVRLLGSGAILREVIAASELLKQDWHISSDVWSVTSFTELAREAREAERCNRLHPQEPPRRSYLEACLAGETPVVAATDYVCAYPQSIAPYLEVPFTALGTDGFGRSDTRANLRRFFEVDRHHIAVAGLQALAQQGQVSSATVATAIRQYGVDISASAPWLR
jgi:pyruvate dehydrogenase E1 component